MSKFSFAAENIDVVVEALERSLRRTRLILTLAHEKVHIWCKDLEKVEVEFPPIVAGGGADWASKPGECSTCKYLKDLESAEKTIESMHRTHNFIVQEYQKDLETVRHELQMPSWYFLENLAKRLEENDQCNVVITTVGR